MKFPTERKIFIFFIFLLKETIPDEPIGLHPDAKVPRLPGHIDVEIDYKTELARFEDSVRREGKEKKKKYEVEVDGYCQIQSACVGRVMMMMRRIRRRRIRRRRWR